MKLFTFLTALLPLSLTAQIGTGPSVSSNSSSAIDLTLKGTTLLPGGSSISSAGLYRGNGVQLSNVIPTITVWRTNGFYYNYSNNIVGALTSAIPGDTIVASAGHFYINERCNVGSPGSAGVTRSDNVSLIMNPGTWLHSSNTVDAPVTPTIHPGNNFVLQGGNSICDVTNFTTIFLGCGSSGNENNVPYTNVVVRDHNGYGQSDWYYDGSSAQNSVVFINSRIESHFDCIFTDVGVKGVSATGSTFISTADSPLITASFSRCEPISIFGGGYHRFTDCQIICNTNTTGYPTYGVYFGNTITKGTNIFLGTSISGPTNAIFSAVAVASNNVVYGSYYDEVLKTFVVNGITNSDNLSQKYLTSLDYFEDFAGKSPAANVAVGPLAFYGNVSGGGSAIAASQSSSNEIGILRLSAAGVAGTSYIAARDSVSSTLLPITFSGVWTNEWKFRLQDTNNVAGVNNYSLIIGYEPTPDDGVMINGLALTYTSNSVFFAYTSANGGVTTTNFTTLQPATNTWYKFRSVITVNATTTNAVCTIDGAQRITFGSTDNLPVASCLGAGLLRRETGLRFFEIDYCYLGYQTLVPR